jgi:hypothetical protein
LVRSDFRRKKKHCFEFLDPPSAPAAPEIDEIFATTCRIQWLPPSSDGGSPITGYFIERHLQGASRWSKVNKLLTAPDVTQIIAEELVEGSEYEFRVIACNKVGQSEPSAPSRMIVAKNPFGMFKKKNFFCQNKNISFDR